MAIASIWHILSDVGELAMGKKNKVIEEVLPHLGGRNERNREGVVRVKPGQCRVTGESTAADHRDSEPRTC